ncbi:hypothetical protein B0H34DRAFT_675765 [Crassisporium funariophilum]|nr:hypothetical protein B0H34DRAFT_675765 [Crassisporium funariophilum]
MFSENGGYKCRHMCTQCSEWIYSRQITTQPRGIATTSEKKKGSENKPKSFRRPCGSACRGWMLWRADNNSGKGVGENGDDELPLVVYPHPCADRLLEFFLQEQNKLNNIHREELRNAVARYNELKLRSESDLAVTQFKSQSRTIALHDISAKYQKAQHDAIMARQELEELRAEHERLKAAVKQVGFVYTDGTLSPGQDSREHSSQVLDQH